MTHAHSTTDDRGEKNARSHLATICEWHAAACAANDAEDCDAEDAVREEAMESPLCIEVRGGWHNVGAQEDTEEAAILLSTGGPACRVHATLGRYCEPDAVTLQCQDWFTPWIDVETSEEEDANDCDAAAHAQHCALVAPFDVADWVHFTPGWYWQACFPGCLPDGSPCGPFATEAEAMADAGVVA